MIDSNQIKRIINETLQRMGSKYSSPKALELVYNTGLVESKYVYLRGEIILQEDFFSASLGSLYLFVMII